MQNGIQYRASVVSVLCDEVSSICEVTRLVCINRGYDEYAATYLSSEKFVNQWFRGVCPSPVKKRPLYVNGVDGCRISGAGTQNKLIVRLEAGRILLPLLAADLGQGRKRRG